MTISWALPIGTVVRGADCIGRPFEAAIVDDRGPLTPVLSDGYVTGASLIKEVVSLPEVATADDDGFLPNAPLPADEPVTGQLSLF